MNQYRTYDLYVIVFTLAAFLLQVIKWWLIAQQNDTQPAVQIFVMGDYRTGAVWTGGVMSGAKEPGL